MANRQANEAGSLRQRRPLALQAAALAAIIGGSLALYGALQAGADVLAAACFALVGAAFALTMWVS